MSAEGVETTGETTQSTTLFVGNLAWSVNETTLQDHFATAGQVEKVSIPRDHRNYSKGFGYVTFATRDDAQKALEKLNATELEGREIRLDFDQGPGQKKAQKAQQAPSTPSGEPTNILFIGNLSFQVEEEQLREIFKEFQGITEVRIARDRDTNRSRGFGFVEFESSDQASKAIALNGTELQGRNIRLDYQSPRTPGAGPSGGRGRGGSRGRGGRGGGFSRGGGGGRGGGFRGGRGAPRGAPRGGRGGFDA